ncbi:hypothetical protein GCM10020220_065400 [Nonomuraea rubra]|uniref:hypothetical protein n=1 Tax=Nonomuraea rubra TaxID=46180 RepID=UPI0031E9CC11
MIERLPTPYGLVRYGGGAPHHTSIKSIANYLRRVLELPQVRFLGGVTLGSDVSVEDLLGVYDAVVYCTGAMVDRKLGIPGEDLPGSVAATDFVNWYCGHPDVDPARFTLDTSERSPSSGSGTSPWTSSASWPRPPRSCAPPTCPTRCCSGSAESEVKAIHMVGRRGPEHAKITLKELRELGELANADVCVRPDEAVRAGRRLPAPGAGQHQGPPGVGGPQSRWAARAASTCASGCGPWEILGTESGRGAQARTHPAVGGGARGRHRRVRDAAAVGMVLRARSVTRASRCPGCRSRTAR